MSLKTVWVVTRTKFTKRGNTKVYLVTPLLRPFYGHFAAPKKYAYHLLAPEVAQEEADKYPRHGGGAGFTYDAAKIEQIRVRVP